MVFLKDKDFSLITPALEELATLARANSGIDPALYERHAVKRGLRDLKGNGVLTGLTEISEIVSKKTLPDGTAVPCDGELYYRGVNVQELIDGFVADDRFGFEETIYLLLFGCLPDEKALADFHSLLGDYRCIPPNFVRDIIMKKPSRDIMNAMARSVLMLYSYDNRADDISLPNVLRQSLQLISEFPLLAVYNYQAYAHYHQGGSLIIHAPDPRLSTAECILHLLRPDQQYTKLEAQLLDLALILHAEHGGGNNSTFTTHVVTSSGSDTYSTIVASLGSLKGPKHGGANLMVMRMFEDIKEHVKDWSNESELRDYLDKILKKQAFDRTGLIYGMGHAVYSLSDPRARIFKGFVEKLSREKGREEEYALYTAVERIGAELIAAQRNIYKGVSANVDFFSGFAYSMLGLPIELFTPLFATARVVGWSAHRCEELINAGKIIRPAYMNVQPRVPYVPMKER
ncbi:MAG: citrate/2-methylcitrate synthase [Clostridia bacterium]|nr:citrate/2-methylcitrate synthase [Clostridia bacterium]